MIKTKKAARQLFQVISTILAGMMIEALVNGTGYTFILFAGTMAPIFTIKCRNGQTRIYDQRIASIVRGHDLEIFDSCPVCGQDML